ncbi:hypothetical protein H9L39_06304 [Fusarium oxysporum f. sp. albedinis]|nr:hypothetical protein H9L39_06304 [Fusarium oxysporum f. sp. albedinis]
MLRMISFTAQQKPTDPKNDKPTNHLQLAKRSMAKNDQPTNHPQLAKRSMTGHDKPTDHPKLARPLFHATIFKV